MAGTVQYYNLTGGLNTVQSIGTINQSPKRTESPDMQNVEYYKLGGLKSMEGNTQLANTLPASISLGYEYVYKNEKYLIVTTTDGTVYKYNKIQNVFDKIYKFPTPTARHSICTFNNGIVISNGVDDLVFYESGRHQQLTGTVTTQTDSSGVIGKETKFKEELVAGDYIVVGDESYRVESITDDTNLLLTGVARADAEDSPFYLGELSELNATYVNTAEGEDSVSRPVRGLALNSYQGRLFVGGEDGILYYSEVGLIHGWDNQYGAGAIPSFYDDNSDFTALGLWDKYLVICKRERSYLLDGTDANDANWVLQPYSDYTCDSQQSWIVANNAFIVYSRVAGGIYPLLQRTIYNPNYQGTDLSIKIRDSFEYVNQAKYDNIYPVYYPRKAYIMFYIPLLTGNGSNNCFIYDIRTKTWLLRKVPQEVTIAFRWNDEIYIGTKDGKILKEFNGLTFDGEAIEWYWKSPWFSFGQGSNYLSSREFRINLAEESTNRFKIRNRRDGKDTYDVRNITNNLNAFNGLVWDLGYNRDDLSTSYKPTRTIYKVTDGTTDYYTSKSGEENTVVVYGTKLFLDKELTKPAGWAGVNYNLVYGTEGDDSGAITNVKIEKTAYKWSHSHKAYIKYSNGTEYVWIPWNTYNLQQHSECLFSKNIAPQILGYKYDTGTVNWQLFQGQIPCRVTFFISAINPIVNNNGTITPQNPDTLEPTDIDFTGAGQLGFSGTKEIRGTLDDIPDNVKLYINGSVINGFTTFTWDYGTFPEDKIETVYSEAHSGAEAGDITDADHGALSSVIRQDDGKFTVIINDIEVKDLEFVGEDGDDVSNTFYTTEPTITEGLTLFESINGRQLATGIKDNNAVYLVNNQVFTPISEGTVTYYSYAYQVKEIINYIYTGETSEEPDPLSIPLPTEEDYNIESLTETVWDEDSWVILSHKIKRFPLASQYFNTLQVEFYGNDINEGMSIYGFEIDGVQLEEVPW